jgi:hypothetical protein
MTAVHRPCRIAPSAGTALLCLAGAHAVEFKFQPVADGLFAYIGDTGPRSAVSSFDAQPFMRLQNAADLMPGNASRTYVELERD